jgi:hypothetical protein
METKSDAELLYTDDLIGKRCTPKDTTGLYLIQWGNENADYWDLLVI